MLSPRIRQGRPLSTEFKSSKEFRPLWLVEWHAGEPSRRKEVPEEVYPSLPSSHSNSRASSVHDSEQDDANDLLDRWTMDEDETLSHEPPVFDERELDYRPDLLDSQQPTPTKDSFQMERANEEARHTQRSSSVVESPFTEPFDFEGPLFNYCWEDPRELPSLPNSRASSTYDESMSHNISSTFQGAAAGALATAAALTAASTLHHDQDREQQAQAISPSPEPGVAAKGESSVANFEAGVVEPVAEIEPPTVVQDFEEDEKAGCIDGGDTLRDEPALSPIVAAPEPMPFAEDKEDTLIDELHSVEEEAVQATSKAWSASISKKGERKNRGIETLGALDTPVQETPDVSDIPEAFQEEQEPAQAPEDYSQNPASSKKGKNGKKGKGKSASTDTPEAPSTSIAIPDEDTFHVAVRDWPTSSISKKGKKGKTEKRDSREVEIPSTPELSREVPDEPLAAVDDWTVPSTSKKGKKGKQSKYRSQDSEIPEILDMPGVLATDLKVQPEGIDDTASRDLGQDAAEAHNESHDKQPERLDPTQPSEDVPDRTVFGTIFAAAAAAGAAVASSGSKKEKKRKGKKKGVVFEEEPANNLPECQAVDEAQTDQSDLPTEASRATKQYDKQYDEPSIGEPRPAQDLTPPVEEQEPTTFSGAPGVASVKPMPTLQEDQEQPQHLEQRDFNEAIPADIRLPKDDDLDLLPALPNSPILEPLEPSVSFGVPDVPSLKAMINLQENQEPPRQLKQHGFQEAIPTDIGLPLDDDLDLLPALPDSPMLEPKTAREVDQAPPSEHYPPSILQEHLAETDGMSELKEEITPHEAQSSTTDIEHVLQAPVKAEPVLEDTVATPAYKTVQGPEGQDPYIPELREMDDDASIYSMKKGKKGKKSRKSLPVTPVINSLPEEPEASRELAEAIETAQGPLAESLTQEPFQLAKEELVTREAEDDDSIYTMKKGKKGRRSLPVTPVVESLPEEPEATRQLTKALEIAAETSLPGSSMHEPSIAKEEFVSREVDDDLVYAVKKGKKGKKGRKSLPVTPVIESLPEEPEAAQQLTETLETTHGSVPESSVEEQTLLAEEGLAFKEQPSLKEKGKKGKKEKLALDDWATESSQPNSSESSRDLPTETLEKKSQEQSQESEIITPRDDGSSFPITAEKGAVDEPSVPASIPTVEPTPANDSTAEGVKSMSGYPHERSIGDPIILEKAVVPLAKGSLPSGDVEESEQLFREPKSKKDKKKRKSLSRSESSYQNAVATMEPPSKTVRTLESLAEKDWPPSSENLVLDEASNRALPDDNDNDLLTNEAGGIELSGYKGIDVHQVQTSMTALPAEGSEILAVYQKRAAPLLDFLDEAVQTPLPQDDWEDYFEVQEGVRELGLDPKLDRSDAAGLTKVSWQEPKVTKPGETTFGSPLPNIFDEAVYTPLPQDDRDDFFEPHQGERKLQSDSEADRNNASSLPKVRLQEPEVTKSVEPSVEPSHERTGRGQDLVDPPQQQSYFPQFDPILDDPIQIPLPEDQQDDYFDSKGSEEPGEDFISDFNPSKDLSMPLSKDIPRELEMVPHVEEIAAIAPANNQILTEDPILPAEPADLDRDLGEPAGFETTSSNKKAKKDKKKGESKAREWSEKIPAETAQAKSVSEPADNSGIVTRSLSVIGGLVAGSAVAGALDFNKSKKDKKKNKLKAVDWEEKSASESAQEQSTAEPAELSEAALGNIQPAITDELSATQDEPPVTVDEPPLADDDMGFLSSRKGKKGKKKGKSLALNLDDDPAMEAERQLGAEPTMSAEVEPPALLPAEVDKTTAGSEDSDIVSSQKSKRDKRKSKSQATSWEEETLAQELQLEPEPTRSIEDSFHKPIPAITLDEAAPVADVSEFPTYKKIKKDKKKRASATEWDDSPSTQETQTIPESESASSIDKSFNELEPTLTVGEAAPGTDSADFFISKRGKKDKKKGKKGQAYDWNDESTGTTTPALSETVPLAVGTEDAITGPDANQTAIEAAAIEFEPTESFNLKKSKKDRKKAKKSATMAWDEEPEQIPTLVMVKSTDKDRAMFVPEENLTEVPFVQPTVDAVPEEAVSKEVETGLPTPAPQDELEPEGSGYFSLKKSKKDKKKAKKDDFMARDEELEPTAALQEIVSTDKDRAIVVPEEQLAEVPFQPHPAEQPPQQASAKTSQDKLAPPTEFGAPATVPESIREDKLHKFDDGKQFDRVPETIAPGTGRDLTQEAPSFAEDPSLDVSGFRTEQGTVDNDDFGGFAIKKKKTKKGRNARQAESTNTIPDIETPLEEPTTVGELESTRNSTELFDTTKASPVLDERGAPASQDDFLDFGTIKRKKSKKSKKQAPVIWEDETATPASIEVPTYTDEGVAGPSSQPLETLYENEPYTPLEPTHQDHVSPSDPVHKPDLDRQFSEDTTSQTLEQGEYTIPSLEDILREEDAADQKDYDPAVYDEIRKQAFERELKAASREEPIVQEQPSSPIFAQDGRLRVVTDQLSVNQAEEALGMSRSGSRIGKHRKGDRSPAGRRSSASSSSRSLGLLPGDVEHSPRLHHSPHSPSSPSSPRALSLLPRDAEHAPSPHAESHAQGPSLSEEASLYQDSQAKEAPIDNHPFHVQRNSIDQPIEHETAHDQYHEESLEPSKSSEAIQDREPMEPSHDMERGIPIDVTQGKQPKNIGRAAAIVPSVGAGVALFENLARKNSVTENDKGKKRSGVRRSELEESNRRQASSERPGESHDTTRALSITQDPPAIEVRKTRDGRDPSILSQDEYRPTTSSPRVSSLQENSDRNRDSAVHVSDSPLPGDLARFHHSMRDSGYQGTEVSPTFRDSLDKAGPYREYRTSGESFANVRDPRDTSLRDSGTTFESSTSMAENRNNPLNILIEVDPAYNVSVSRPDNYGYQTTVSDVRDRDSGEQLPVQYQNRLSRDSVSPVRSHAESQPSPVDSSTKPRSSELFQSSPSTREDLTRNLPHQQTSPSYGVAGLRDSSGSMDDFVTPTKKPAHKELPRSRDIETTHAPTTSLFGGPVGINSDLQSSISPPGTPLGSSRRQLNSISENSPGEITSQKHVRASPDIALSEDGLRKERRSGTPQIVSQRRVRSPLATTSEGKEPISIDDLDSRLSWPAVDEDTHSVDLERSKSRNTDAGRRTSSRHSQSPLPPLATDMTKQQTDYRSVSGASIRSNESITAIIKDQGTRSPSTPPLRRVDRSVSSDLRAANKRSETKKAAKSAEADPNVEPVIASSSTYDPLNDKGKARITKMADVYVSVIQVYLFDGKSLTSSLS